MSGTSSSAATRISSFVLLVIFITLALSLTALILAINALRTPDQETVAGYLSITTIIECKKCGFRNVREFQRGDYIFKEVELCQKCNQNMLITAIYKEVKEKMKRTRF